MKKLLLSAMVLLATCIAAQAQQIDFGEYQSMLQEGRVWVNFFDHIDMSWDPDFSEGDDPKYSITYTYEMRGDSVINGIKYKKCYMKRGEKKPIYESENTHKLKEIDHPVAFLREEGMLVYCRYNKYPQDLFCEHRDYDEDEFLLYDFGAARAQVLLGSCVLEKADLGGSFFNQYNFGSWSLIESVGFNNYDSVLLFIGWLRPTCSIYNYSALSHVLDKDGNVIFKSEDYRPEPPFAAIKDLKAEGEKADNRYYNLQGQPVSNPTQGIYIHNGKKVIVK